MASHSDDPIEVVAEYICVGLYPTKLREEYVRHMRVAYKADLIVYALQALATGMTAIFVGLVTNYLYDKAKKGRRPKERKAIKRLVAQQKRRITQLERLLKSEQEERRKRRVSVTLIVHKRVIVQIEGKKPSIDKVVTNALSDLEKKGTKGLRNYVDSKWKR